MQFENKNSEIFKLCTNKNDAVILLSYINRFWYLQKKSTFGVILFINNKITLFTDNRYFNAFVTFKKYFNVECVENMGHAIKKISEYNINNLIYEDNITVSEYNNIICNINCISKKEYDFKNTRSCKDENEIKNIKKACEIACDSIKYVIEKVLKVGISEIDVKKELIKFYFDNNCDGYSFPPIVAFNKNSAIPHHESNNTKLKKNDLVLIDTGCIYNGYCSDITRTFCFGKPSEEMKKMFNLVLKSQLAGISIAKNNVNCYDVDKTCRDIVENSEYKGLFIHGTGHGVGIEIHELPNNNSFSKDVLKKVIL